MPSRCFQLQPGQENSPTGTQTSTKRPKWLRAKADWSAQVQRARQVVADNAPIIQAQLSQAQPFDFNGNQLEYRFTSCA